MFGFPFGRSKSSFGFSDSVCISFMMFGFSFVVFQNPILPQIQFELKGTMVLFLPFFSFLFRSLINNNYTFRSVFD